MVKEGTSKPPAQPPPEEDDVARAKRQFEEELEAGKARAARQEAESQLTLERINFRRWAMQNGMRYTEHQIDDIVEGRIPDPRQNQPAGMPHLRIADTPPQRTNGNGTDVVPAQGQTSTDSRVGAPTGSAGKPPKEKKGETSFHHRSTYVGSSPVIKAKDVRMGEPIKINNDGVSSSRPMGPSRDLKERLAQMKNPPRRTP